MAPWYTVSFVVVSLLASAAHADVVRPAPPVGRVVVVYDGFGQPDRFRVSGRVLDEGGRSTERRGDSALHNLARTVADLDSNEVPRVDLTVVIAGVSYSATTDADGMFLVRVKGLPTGASLPIGPNPVVATLDDGGVVGQGTLHIVPAVGGVGLVSDIDDTVVKTFVTDRGRMAQTVLLHNGAQLEPVAGAAAAYRRARRDGVDAVFYVSSSPQNLYQRLHGFLGDHGFPGGALFLKNLGDDSLLAHDSYKLEKLGRIATDLPGLRFVLVGDSGERDPEIYREFRKRHPDRVMAVIIRLVPGSKHLEAERFAGMVTVDDSYGNDAVIADLLRAVAPTH
jgi:phosphatidate phosphatase APP1